MQTSRNILNGPESNN